MKVASPTEFTIKPYNGEEESYIILAALAVNSVAAAAGISDDVGADPSQMRRRLQRRLRKMLSRGRRRIPLQRRLGQRKMRFLGNARQIQGCL